MNKKKQMPKISFLLAREHNAAICHLDEINKREYEVTSAWNAQKCCDKGEGKVK